MYFCFNTIICLPLILFHCTFSDMEESKKTAAVALHREQICNYYILQTINQVINGHIQLYSFLDRAFLAFCLMNLFIVTDVTDKVVETMNGFYAYIQGFSGAFIFPFLIFMTFKLFRLQNYFLLIGFFDFWTLAQKLYFEISCSIKVMLHFCFKIGR